MSTFVIRVAAGREGTLQGTVLRVATGETRSFARGGELLAFLEQWNAAEAIRRRGRTGGSKNRKLAAGRRCGPTLELRVVCSNERTGPRQHESGPGVPRK